MKYVISILPPNRYPNEGRSMGDKITLTIQERELHGKKLSDLRKQGLVPGVVYGADMEAVSIQAAEGEIAKVVKAAGRHTPVQLTGKKRRIAMIKDVDRDPVKHTIRHVSFHAVRADEPVTAEVPIRLLGEGESVAERNGLVILQALEQIEVKALPMELPEALEVSIVDLAEAGDRVTVGDITVPSGVEVVDNDDGRADDEDEERQTVMNLVVASVYEPGALQAANDAVGGDAEEVIADAVDAENSSENLAEKKAE